MGVELRDNETGECAPPWWPFRTACRGAFVPSAEAERYVMLEDLVRSASAPFSR
ncbi:MAG: hypothetical protein ACLSUW_08805 [Akkermansia sp.]